MESNTASFSTHFPDFPPVPCTAVEEISNNARFLCASILLDQKPDHLQQYLANAVYESCRGGELRLQGFPDFTPLIQGLKESVPETETYEYQVCAKRGSKLVVLGSLANKWLQSEDFGAEATSLIENHNKNFNIDGDFVEDETDRTHGTVSPRNPWLSKSLVVLSEICKKLIDHWVRFEGKGFQKIWMQFPLINSHLVQDSFHQKLQTWFKLIVQEWWCLPWACTQTHQAGTGWQGLWERCDQLEEAVPWPWIYHEVHPCVEFFAESWPITDPCVHPWTDAFRFSHLPPSLHTCCFNPSIRSSKEKISDQFLRRACHGWEWGVDVSGVYWEEPIPSVEGIVSYLQLTPGVMGEVVLAECWLTLYMFVIF